MLYTEDLKTKLFKDKNNKKYTPASLYLGSKKTGGYSILEPSQKEIEIFNGYNDSAFIKINGESSQVTSNAGKNLLDPAKILFGYNSFGSTVTDTKVEYGSQHANVASYLIKLTPSTSYRLRKEFAGNRYRCFYYETYPLGEDVASIGGSYRDSFTDMSISFPATAKWMFVVLSSNLTTYPIGNTQLEQGTSHTTFAEFVPNRPSPDYPSNINSPSNFDLITRKNNLISNGNFENGTTDFANYGGFSLSAVDNVLTATGNTAVVGGTIGQTTDLPVILNQKIYFRCKIKPKHPFTSIDAILRGSTSGTTGTVIFQTISNLTVNNEYILEGIATASELLTGNVRIGIRGYNSVSNILGMAFEIKEVIAIDMGVSSVSSIYNKTVTEMNAIYPNWDDKESKTINFPYTLNRFTDGTADYIEIDNINKTAKLYNNVGNFVLTEDMGFVTYTYNNLLGVQSSLSTDLIFENYIRVAGVCSHEKRVGAFYSSTGTYMWIGVNNQRIYWIGILDWLGFTTITQFKTWLGEQAASGNTVTCMYKLITPVVTNLNYDEVTTYYPYTKIYTNATVQPTLDGKIRVQGENKSAIDLTTTDAQISMGNNNALRLRNNFTVACFIKSTIIPTSNQYFLRRYDVGINGRCWGMIRTSTRPAPQNKGLTVLVSSNGTTGNYVYGTGNIDTTDGNWHHMAFTYSDKTVKMYVDGVLDKEELVTALTSNDLFDTASVFDSAPSYSGLLDDIRYYSRVLTDDEILKLSKGLKVSDTNMVGHWKCNEGKGTTVKNETNIPNTDGVLNAQAKWTNDTIYQ